MRGTTHSDTPLSETSRISIHVPREGDDDWILKKIREVEISIHVPREGDDLRLAMVTQMYYISIHVPREGDDSAACPRCSPHPDFNPRPP